MKKSVDYTGKGTPLNKDKTLFFLILYLDFTTVLGQCSMTFLLVLSTFTNEKECSDKIFTWEDRQKGWQRSREPA